MKNIRIALFAAAVSCAFVQPVSAVAETVLYSFCSQMNCADGEFPISNQIDVNGTLYGTTLEGGAHQGGTVFALNPNTGAETVLYSFSGGTDGALPVADLIEMNGLLYGTTTAGGIAQCKAHIGCGTVFSLDPNTGTEQVLYSFCRQHNCADGAYPVAGLIDVNGVLYGTTSWGGNTTCSRGCGTVFSLDPNTGVEQVLYAFGGRPDGLHPKADLINVNGVLYGTTVSGGARGGGTVFAFNPNTAEIVVYSLCNHARLCKDGRAPQAALIDVNGVLYGTASGGGTTEGNCLRLGCGTVFSFDPNSGDVTLLYAFGGTDGWNPIASLFSVNGKLYGTTLWGGAHGDGTVFALNPNTRAETVLHSFCSKANCADGRSPAAGLIEDGSTLYGTTGMGGANSCYSGGCGTVFALTTR